MKPREWLPLLEEIADRSDEISLRHFRAQDLRVEEKPDRTPVTEADLAVEEAARALIRDRHPELGVLGEEHGEAAGTGETRLIIDPIDSTANFARGIPIFATLLAIESEGEVVAGFVSAPALGARWSAVDAAGLYVPGGRAAYPSSLLMNVIPAKVAGVARIAMVTPTPGGEINPLVLAAAQIAGIEEIWRVGGAQAVAALAYGTGRIRPVDVITGPGNAWVAEAKRQLYGVVGIDMVAGPSEIVVVADGRNDPEWTAADLLSQSEHDPTSQSILFTDDAAFADAVAAAVERQLPALSTSAVARTSWNANGAIIIVRDLDEAMPLVNALAPEHLELAVEDPEPLFARVRHAGSVFLGRMTPEAVGDYVAGPNHVLPTGRRARFSSGLSVLDFMKRTSFLSLDRDAIGAIGPAAVALAQAEGLPAHAASVALRLS